MNSIQILQTIEQIRASPNLSEESKRLLETCPVNPNPKSKYTRQPNPVRVICPKCDYVGRLNSFHPGDSNGKVFYYIAHENAKGTWNHRTRRVSKYRRCYLNLNKQSEYFKNICNQLFPILDD